MGGCGVLGCVGVCGVGWRRCGVLGVCEGEMEVWSVGCV